MSITYAERTFVERAGIILAVVVAICWGSADTVATFAARRQGTFVTTFISLVVSVILLVQLSGNNPGV